MNFLIRNATVINENKKAAQDIFIKDGLIAEIIDRDSTPYPIIQGQYEEIDATDLILIPGVIDDQVHFREPGLTHKADIYTESKAAVAGGITSYMEMPNTSPGTTTSALLKQKYEIASEKSWANYSFYIGATNRNIDELMKIDPTNVCGTKIFMGSSTGNLLVDNREALDIIFKEVRMLIATHCEDDRLIKKNLAHYTQTEGENLTVSYHPLIRSAEACYASSSLAVELATKHNTRLHILHLSTAKEMVLFNNKIPVSEKKITAEACVHHLWFNDSDYARLGNFIKWNPAVKTKEDQEAVFEAVLNGKIDVIATDHAPHTIEEKSKPYLEAPSGGPLVQHALPAMLDFYHRKRITLEKIVQLMAHNVADLFKIEKRGYIRKGYYADLVLIDLNKPLEVSKENILYKCGWSPFEGHTFQSRITHTFVNGSLMYKDGIFQSFRPGMRMKFDR
ncbi:MAG: dihydroorotase [Flavobacteriales bacterium]|nr:dihydroorotase [Flavobacteriales bacterium]